MSLPKRVALRIDLPEHNLRKRDVAVLIDHVPHPEGGEQGCVLEVFNALGESIAVVTVPESAIESLRADEVLAVRPLDAVSTHRDAEVTGHLDELFADVELAREQARAANELDAAGTDWSDERW